MFKSILLLGSILLFQNIYLFSQEVNIVNSPKEAIEVGYENIRDTTPSEHIVNYINKSKKHRDTNPQIAIANAIKGLELAQKNNSKLEIGLLNENIGVAYTRKSSYDTAVIYLNDALKLAISGKSKKQEADAYRALGNMYVGADNQTEAFEHYSKALAIYEDIDDKLGQLATLNNISIMHRTFRNMQRSAFYLKKALLVAEEYNEPIGKMQVYLNAGVIYFQKGEHEIGREYTIRALELSRDIGDIRYELSSLKSLAVIYSFFKEYEKALSCCEEVLELSREMGDVGEMIWAWLSLSNTYRYMGWWEDVISSASKAWELDSMSYQSSSNIAFNMALANIKLGHQKDAEKFLNKYSEVKSEYINKVYEGKLADLEVKYETEKKEIRIAALEKHNEFYTYLIIAGAAIVLLLLMLLIIRNNLNINKRIISEQQINQLEREKQLAVSQSMLDGETSERTRLARDLHDGLGGMLSVVKLNLGNTGKYLNDSEEGYVYFDATKDMLDRSISELRRVSHNLMPESLLKYGLTESLEDFCRAVPGAEFQAVGGDIRLPLQMEITLYRCAHELINNALKYASAQNIKVQLLIDERLIALTVQDDGTGFDLETTKLGNGLKNIMTRISAYNGKTHIYSYPGRGTEVSIEIEKSSLD